MDNFFFDMVCEGESTLAAAVALVCQAKGRSAITHYAIRPAFEGVKYPAPEGAHDYQMGWDKPPKGQRIVFYDNRFGKPQSEDQAAFPFTLDPKGAADFAHRWLAELDYGREPDHDGDNGKGWRVYVEGWGHVDSHYSAIVAVSPRWAMYGK